MKSVPIHVANLFVAIACSLPCIALPANVVIERIESSLTVIETWRASPEVILRWCDKKDPNGALGRQVVYETWAEKNAGLIAESIKIFSEVAPLVMTPSPGRDAVGLMRSKISLEIVKTEFFSKNEQETLSFCSNYANSDFPLWSWDRLKRARAAVDLVDALKTVIQPEKPKIVYGDELIARTSLRNEYFDRIRVKIMRLIVPPRDLQGNLEAEFDLLVFPNGDLMYVKLKRSSGNAEYDAAVERAISRAQPLPIPQDRELAKEFKELRLKFRAKE